MPIYTREDASRIAVKLKKILRNELGEDTKLGHCQEAVAEALDFDHSSQMFSSLPCETTWNIEWCVNHLIDRGRVQDPASASKAAERLEATIGRVLAGRELGPFEGQLEALETTD